MALIKDGALADDPFVNLDDDDALPASGPVSVTSARWFADRDALIGHDGDIAVRLGNDQDTEAIAADLERIAAIFIEFPSFSDGRGFSQARELREEHGFGGEIRARGHIIRDQYLFLHRCGVDAVEVEGDDALGEWNKAMEEFSTFYQRTVDERTPAMALRRRGGKAAN